MGGVLFIKTNVTFNKQTDTIKLKKYFDVSYEKKVKSKNP